MNRPQEQTVFVSRNAHQVVRLLIASYFIAAATGAVPFESGWALALMLVPAHFADAAVSTFVFTCAFLILIGFQIRAAALLLALFLFWSSFTASFGPLRSIGFADFWRDLVLIGALLLTYINGPHLFDHLLRPARRPLGRRAKRITPRRIVVSRPTADPAACALPGPSNLPPFRFPQIDGGGDDVNLFDRVFDAA